MFREQKLLFSWWPRRGRAREGGREGEREGGRGRGRERGRERGNSLSPGNVPDLPGVLDPATFMYSCTEFIPRTVCPIWDSKLYSGQVTCSQITHTMHMYSQTHTNCG